MFSLSFLLYAILASRITVKSLSFFGDTFSTSTLDCPNDKKCISIEHCPVVLNLLDRSLLPIHRFRQAICGYENARPKVCCNADGSSANPTFIQENSVLRTKSNSVPECGKSLVQSNVNTVGTYPFVARIGFKSITGDVKYLCSGVILNERTVLTTASCALAKSNNYKLYSVLVGEFNADSDPDCNILFCGLRTRKHDISYVIKHPNYQADTFASNIALLRLTEPIQYSVTVQPVCFISRDRYEHVGSNAVLVGWGKLSNQEAKSGNQQSLKMKIVPNQECSSYFAQGMFVDLCAIGEELPCAGYSGSPLLFKYGDTHYLLGILSYGSNCNSGANFPSVFINVQRYIRWILENC